MTTTIVNRVERVPNIGDTIMPTHKYDIVKNGKIVATFFSMMQAHEYCEQHGGNIEITKL